MANRLTFDNIKNKQFKKTYKTIEVEDNTGQNFIVKMSTNLSNNDIEKFANLFVKFFEEWELDGTFNPESQYYVPIISLNAALLGVLTDIPLPDNKNECIAFLSKLVKLGLVSSILSQCSPKLMKKLGDTLLDILDYTAELIGEKGNKE